MKINVYSSTGTTKGEFNLPEQVFALPWNGDLVHDVVTSMQANARAGTAHTKDRGEVRGGGKKPWRQKGTGRARHGSRRSPIWVGGGVTHGPRNERDYKVKINKKVKAKALGIILSRKLADTEIIALDSLALSEMKTAKAVEVVTAVAKASEASALATKKQNAALVILPERDEVAEKSFRNLGQFSVMQAKDISPVDLLTYKYAVLVNPEATVEILSARVLPMVTN